MMRTFINSTLNSQKDSWENIEKCSCGKDSICHINKKDGTKLYFCWDCFFKYGEDNKDK